MPVKKRNKTWKYSFTVPGYPRQRRGGFKTKAEAEAAEAKCRKELVFGSGRMTFAEGYEEYMQARRRDMKDRTRDAYEPIWRRVKPVLGHLFVEDVNTRAMDTLKNALPVRLSAKTVNNHLALVSAVLGFLRERQVIQSMPYVPMVSVPKGRSACYNQEQRDRLFEGMFRLRPKWYLFVYLTARLGLRAGEVYGISLAQVIRGSAPRLVVDRAVQRGTKERPAKVTTRKNNNAYELDLTDDVVMAIDWHINQGLAGPVYLFSKDGLFPRYLDSHVGPLTTVQKELELPLLSHHKLGRHSVATQAADEQMSAKAIQYQLGHKSEASTHKYIQRGDKAQLRLVTNLRPAMPPHVRGAAQTSGHPEGTERKQALKTEALSA